MPTLTVELNADGVHSIDAPTTFEADRPFTIELDNQGQAIHVHLNLDDALSRVATLGSVNHYVEGEATRIVDVRTAEPTSPSTGRLKIVTGHGAETAYVDVTITPPQEVKTPVQVDESLSKPPKREPDPSIGQQFAQSLEEAGFPAGAAPAIGFAVLAVILALVVGVVIGSPVVLFGVGIVVGAAIVAVFLAIR